MALSTGAVLGTLLVGAAVVGAYVYLERPPPPPPSPPPPAPRLRGKGAARGAARSGTPEALQWLTANGNPHGFASNTFRSTGQARDFVRVLYVAGATRVRIADIYGEPERVQEEGGPYADTLLVSLPRDPEARARIQRNLESLDPTELQRKGPSTLRVFWD